MIFDFCGNFEFFRADQKGTEGRMVQSLTEKIFNTKVELIRELQDLQAQEEDYMMHRQELVQQALAQVSSLDDENFRGFVNI